MRLVFIIFFPLRSRNHTIGGEEGYPYFLTYRSLQIPDPKSCPVKLEERVWEWGDMYGKDCPVPRQGLYSVQLHGFGNYKCC